MEQERRAAPVTAAETETWEAATRFPLDRLRAFVIAVFEVFGMERRRAETAADSMLIADLRGIDSHGVARLPYHALRARRGFVDLAAELTVLRESASTLALDANNGPGLVLAPEAMERCIAKADASGICLATVRRSNHFGIAGYYALLAAKRGLCGVAMTNSSPLVVPMFGARGMLGTNPLAVAVPTGDGPPLVLDMSTSTVAWGKIEIARRAGAAIPAGWALDEFGLPTTDPLAARWLTPLGGERITSGHKGYGLGVVVDLLCGPLAGAAWGAQISGAGGRLGVSGIGHTFMAWRIDAFRDPDAFYADVAALIADLRTTPPAPGYEATGVLVPGDPEVAAEARNRAEGVPVKAEVLAELRLLAAEWGVAFSLDDAVSAG